MPVPLKSLDCLASSLQKQGDVVVHADVDGGGVTADMVIEIDRPGARFRFLKATVVPPGLRITQGGAELLNDGGHAGRDVLMTEKPAGVLGTFRLSEPSRIPEPNLLSFVNVTVRFDGFDVVPPGAITAGLAELQPIWPPPQITAEYGLFGVAPALALMVRAASAATSNATRPARNRTASMSSSLSSCFGPALKAKYCAHAHKAL